MQQDQDLPQCVVIIPAAGIGSRMNSELPKQFLDINGVPVLARSCIPFLEFDTIEQLIIALHPEYQEQTKKILRDNIPEPHHKKLHYVIGGKTRQDSVQAGLDAVPDHLPITLVHDAARPLIDEETIRRTITGANTYGAVIAAVPVKDTIKKVDQEKRIIQTIDRTPLWQAQTPQAAKTPLIKQAFNQAEKNNFAGTDEASILEFSNIDVHVVYGNENNIKITHPEDILFAQHFFKQEDQMKIGHGFDAHRFAADRPLILGGEHVEYHLGLAGHSDADVLCHALTDAILGALGKGDIGKHFPDNDPTYKNISSLLLLKEVMKMATRNKKQLINADMTIICQKPKLAPYLEAMKNNLARICNTDPENINIKATTTEKMGFTGRGEGISAHAVVLLGTS